MNNTRLLRVALSSNAIFSMGCAIVMLTTPGWVGHMLGIQMPFVLRMIGIGLVIFAIDLIYQATRYTLSVGRSLYATMADFLWVLGTLVFIALFSELLTESGLLVVSTIGGFVLIFGVWQFWGIHQASFHAKESGL